MKATLKDFNGARPVGPFYQRKRNTARVLKPCQKTIRQTDCTINTADSISHIPQPPISF